MDAARREPDLEDLLRESAWVRGLARGLLGEGAAAEDLAQDVLVAALDRRPGLEGRRLRGWLRTVAQRLALRSRERRGLREHAERLSAPRDDPGSEADRDADRRVEVQRELSAALAELEPGDRTALVLRYFDGLSTGELARQLGLAEPAARKRVSRALERLRARLDARSGGDRRAWSVAFVAALGPRVSGPPLPASEALLPAPKTLASTLPTAALSAGIMTKTIWTAAAIGVACIWLAFARPWSARPDGASDASGAIVPQLADLRSIGDGSTHGDAALAHGERLALDFAGAQEAAPPARVRVVDVNGAAVAGARVAWIDVGGVASALELSADGSAPRPETSRSACFVAVAEGHGSARAPAGPSGDDVVITLPPTRTLRGRVLEDGAPPREPLRLLQPTKADLQGFRSSEFDMADVLRALGMHGLPDVRVVVTEADGSFSLSGVTVGMGAQLILPSTHQLLTVDGQPQDWRPWIPADATDVLIETARLPSVVGRMIWEDTGEPLNGSFDAWFRSKRDVNSTNDRSWLDEGGRFSFGVPIEPLALREPFEMRSAALVTHSVRLVPDQVGSRALPFEHTIDLTDVSFPLDVGTIRVPRAPVLHLRLLGPEGEPIAGAAVASDLTRKTGDADGRVSIAAGQGPLHVLALDCALGEFAVPKEPTSAESPLELRLAPGATLELVTQHGDGPSPLAGRCVRFSWCEAPFEGAHIGRPGYAKPMHMLYLQLFGWWAWKDMNWGNGESMIGRVTVMLPARGPLLVPGWRLGATARLELLDAVDQPLAEVELRVPDEPRRFTADLTGVGPDTGRLRLIATDASGRLLGATSFFVRPQGGTHTKSVHVDESSLDLGPLALGHYDVTVRVHGCLEQQLDGLEATLDPPVRKVVVVAARTLNVALVDEAGQTLRASALELRGETGRWSPRSLTQDQVAGWAAVHDLPCTPLELAVVIGTRTWTRAVDAEQTTLSLDLPVHGRLALSVHARELLTGDDGRLAVKLRELGGEGSLAEEVSVDRDGVGPSTATFDLLPGRYELSVDFEEYENPEVALETDEPSRKPLLRREVEVRARERTDVTAGHE